MPDNEPNEVYERSEFLQLRHELRLEAQQAIATFDKALLTLSAGAIALSFTLLEQFVADSSFESWIMISAWICLGLSVATILVSFICSYHAIEGFRSSFERYYLKKSTDLENTNSYAIATSRLNWISVAAFICGATLLLLFAIMTKSGVIQ